MLDPNRIESIARKFKTLWGYYPDWSFTQIIELVKCGCDTSKCVSDVNLERRLDQLIEMSETMSKTPTETHSHTDIPNTI